MTDIISIIEKIVTDPDFEFCDDESERALITPQICVFKKGEFVGKIRFADHTGRFCPSVDDSILIELGLVDS